MTETAEALLCQVSEHAKKLGVSTSGVERGFACLGYLLLEVAEMQYWRIQFETFREYLKDVAPKCNKSAGQLQQYFLTVRDLSDTFNREQLESIGITKAILLRGAKDYAIVLPREVVNAAMDPNVTAKELKKIISIALRLPGKEEDGDWMDCEMEFMVSPEQRETIEAAIYAATHTDPLTKATISKSAQMLDVMIKLSQEFLGAHSGDGQ